MDSFQLILSADSQLQPAPLFTPTPKALKCDPAEKAG